MIKREWWSTRKHLAAAYLAFQVGSACVTASTVTYEGSSLPELSGWERVGTFDANRSIEDGSLVLSVDLGVWGPLPGGEQDFYQRDVSGPGEEPFFLEWRVESTAPSTELEGTGGSAVVLSARYARYHFTITEDLVRVLRDVTIDPMWISIEPGIAHVYRLEIPDDTSFQLLIDGDPVLTGTPEGPLGTDTSRLIWGSKMWNTPSVNTWDYVRYGTMVPEPATGVMLLAGGAVLALRHRRRRCVA